MNYLLHFTEHDIALLADWLKANGELYVDIDYPHSGGAGPNYLVRSMSDLKALIADQRDHTEIVFTIFQRLQYPLRGIANADLLAKALAHIPDGQWYRIIFLEQYYPSPCYSGGSGNSHSELQQDMSELVGKAVGIGQNPFDLPRSQMLDVAGPVFSISVTRSHVYYEPYAQDPGGYKSVINMWRE